MTATHQWNKLPMTAMQWGSIMDQCLIGSMSLNLVSPHHHKKTVGEIAQNLVFHINMSLAL